LQLDIPIETVCYASKLAKERGKTVILSPTPAVSGLPLELYRSVDIITPNKRELEDLTAIKAETMAEMQVAAQALLDLGVKAVVVTAESWGAVLATCAGLTDFPAEDVKVVDSTAARDRFTAALAHSLSKGSDIEQAIRAANEI